VSVSPNRDEVVAFLVEQLAERLGGDVAASAVDHDADLIELGIKSIDAVLVSGEIEDRFGAEIEPVLLFECRTVNRVADRVMDILTGR
jgi:acyl carrier protein